MLHISTEEYINATQEWDKFKPQCFTAVLFPLQDDLPEILKNKKQFAKLTTDWNNARSRWALWAKLSPCVSQKMLIHIMYIFVCVFRSQASTGPQAKQDGLREEVEEAWRRLESIKVPVLATFVARIQPEALNLVLTPDLSVLQDQYSADLYHFATKEEDYANYFIRVSRSCDGSIYFSPECGDNNLISQEKKKMRKVCIFISFQIYLFCLSGYSFSSSKQSTTKIHTSSWTKTSAS